MKSRFVSDPQDTSPSLDTNVLPPSLDLAFDPGGQAQHHQETLSPAPEAILPDLPLTTSEEGPANTGETASAASFALLDIQTNAASPETDSSMASTVDYSSGAGSMNIIGTPVQETNSGPNIGLHIAPPVDTDFTTSADALFAPQQSALPSAVSINFASLMPTPLAGHVAVTVADSSGVEAALLHPASQATSADAVAPVTGITSLASLDNSGPGAAVTNSAVGSGGANAAQVQQALDESGLSVNGSGIKVGVLSDSFNDLGGAAADEADGALPSASKVQVLSDLSSGGSDEGRAMMQIIHDIAPGSNLAFYTADNSEQNFANGILSLAASGCKVICDDVTYFDEPFFQNGIVAQAIEKVESEGVTFVTSAGNDAANAYQAAWTHGSGTFDNAFYNDVELFNGSLAQTITVTAGSALLLQWSEPYGQANPFTSFDVPNIELNIFQNGRLVDIETAGNLNNPFIGVGFNVSGTYQIVIANNGGPDPGTIKEVLSGDGLPDTIDGANTGTVFGHHMTPGAITAGAVNAGDTLPFGIFPTNEVFSSSGSGTELLFADDGTTLSSPDFLEPVAVSGIDNIATTVPGGLKDFFGTSAASASLAGVAALILAANPDLTPTQVEAIMEQTALNIGNAATAGAGLVQVDAAVALATPLAVAGTASEAMQGGAPALLLSGAPIIHDLNSTMLSSATITIADASGNPIAGDLLFVDTSEGNVQAGVPIDGVSLSWNAVTHTLTLSGTATISTYEALLGEVTFQDTSTDTLSGSHPVRTVTWMINDGTDSFDAASQITIDRSPVVNNNAATVTTGETITATAKTGVLSNASDLDGDKLTVTGVSDTANGVGTIGSSLAGQYGVLTLNADGSYSYVANTISSGLPPSGIYLFSDLQDVFTYTVSDGHGGTSTATLNIKVDLLPGVATSNVSEIPNQTLQASSLFTAFDPNGFAITEYQFWDRTSDSASGHLYFNGVQVADHTVLDVTAAQLSEVTFVTGTDPTALEVRAYDGINWSASESQLWAPFTVNVTLPQPPVVTTSNVTLNAGQSVQAATLFQVSDPGNLAITEYQFWDRTSDSASGHFYFNGVKVADHTVLDVTAAQLSEVTFVSGTDPTSLEVRAYDGVSWSASENALWAPFTVNVTAAPPPGLPVVTTANVTLSAGQSVQASTLFQVSDPNNLAITEYQFWDRTSDSASGHFYFNGVKVADHTLLDVTAAQLSEVTFVSGTDPTSLEVRAYDGVNWSATESQLWAPFTVSVAAGPAPGLPVVTTANVTEAAGQTVQASTLFQVSDPNNFAITEYQFWDRTSDSASGHFYYNGVLVPDHTVLDVTAAQLSHVTFVNGTDPTSLEVRAYDGVNWSASENALWAPFTVGVTPASPPVVTTQNLTEAAHQTLAASSLFQVSDPNNLAITEYQFWDRTSDPASGHFFFNGAQIADHTVLDVTAAQLSAVTFVTGTDSNALEVRAYDGVSWSASESQLWAPFNVTISSTSPLSTVAASTSPAEAVTLSTGATVADNFVFAPNFGQATVTNFNSVSDTLPIDHTMFATVSALLAATHDDVNGNAVITDAQHDTITLKNVTTAQLLAHQSDFHIV